MNHVKSTVICLIALAFLLCGRESLAALTVTSPSGGTFDAHQDPPGSNIWVVTLNPNPIQSNTLFIVKQTIGTTATVISSLHINRPAFNAPIPWRITVQVGEGPVTTYPVSIGLVTVSEAITAGLPNWTCPSPVDTNGR